MSLIKRFIGYSNTPALWNSNTIQELDQFNMPLNKNDEPCHHFRKFPRTESGELFFDTKFQVELQKASQYHIHYKNFRIELGKNRLKDMAKAMSKAFENE